MNFLLDTHVLIWALENNPTLSDRARSSIISGENMVFVSSVSVWEIGIKRSLGKLSTPDNLLEELKLHRFTSLNITHEHADIAARLPLLHKDPFDRMLVAQAIVENLSVITRDEQISMYSVKVVQA